MFQTKSESIVLSKSLPEKDLQLMFHQLAKKAGYPNLVLSTEDLYENIFRIINIRTGEKVAECYNGTEVYFDYNNHTILIGDFEYKEAVLNLEDNDEDSEYRLSDISAFRPYDKLHKPDLGRGIVFGDGCFTITGIECRLDCELCYITFGPYTLRSDDFLRNCHYLNGDACGYIQKDERS